MTSFGRIQVVLLVVVLCLGIYANAASEKDITTLAAAVGNLIDNVSSQKTASQVLQIASRIYGDYPLHSTAALQEVVKISSSEPVVKRAKELLQSYQKYSDYITDWEVFEPDTATSDDSVLLLKTNSAPDNKANHWKPMPSHTDKDRPWLLDLDKAIGANNHAGYLRTNVWSPKSQKASLYIGSTDAIKVWLNGKVVLASNVSGKITPDEDKVDINLNQGWNVLLMKLTKGSGKWAACARLVSTDDKPLAGLKIIALKQETPGQINLTGTDLSAWRGDTGNWMVVGNVYADPKRNNKRLAWDAGTGAIVTGNGEVNGKEGAAINIYSKAEFADVKAHIEFMVPRKSNSGVYFMGRYEVQVFDSWAVADPSFDDCGGIYQRWDDNRNPQGFEGHAPKVNAALAPGMWQSFDVIFRAPRFDEKGNKIANARFEKVVHNGIVVHENIEVTGPTRSAGYNDEKPTGPLIIQGDHGPVAYRNISIVPLK